MTAELICRGIAARDAKAAAMFYDKEVEVKICVKPCFSCRMFQLFVDIFIAK